jgi:hypothetical protein
MHRLSRLRHAPSRKLHISAEAPRRSAGKRREQQRRARGEPHARSMIRGVIGLMGEPGLPGQ